MNKHRNPTRSRSRSFECDDFDKLDLQNSRYLKWAVVSIKIRIKRGGINNPDTTTPLVFDIDDPSIIFSLVHRSRASSEPPVRVPIFRDVVVVNQKFCENRTVVQHHPRDNNTQSKSRRRSYDRYIRYIKRRSRKKSRDKQRISRSPDRRRQSRSRYNEQHSKSRYGSRSRTRRRPTRSRSRSRSSRRYRSRSRHRNMSRKRSVHRESSSGYTSRRSSHQDLRHKEPLTFIELPSSNKTPARETGNSHPPMSFAYFKEYMYMPPYPYPPRSPMMYPRFYPPRMYPPGMVMPRMPMTNMSRMTTNKEATVVRQDAPDGASMDATLAEERSSRTLEPSVVEERIITAPDQS